MNCSLCTLERGVIGKSEHWTLAVNDNQATIGRVFFALRRHETDVAALTPAEVADLWAFVRKVKEALVEQFAPDHFNYMFLMNLDPHAHFHIFPRYKSEREFAGHTFIDADYGGHYDPQAAVKIDDPTRTALVDFLRAALKLPEPERP